MMTRDFKQASNLKQGLPIKSSRGYVLDHVGLGRFHKATSGLGKCVSENDVVNKLDQQQPSI